MKKEIIATLAMFALFFLAIGSFSHFGLLPGNFGRQVAAVFFADSITVEDIRAKYDGFATRGTQVKILVVPGHDNISFGTQFQGTREADMVADLGYVLAEKLAQDPRFAVTLARTREGFTPAIAEYFEAHKKEIQSFAAASRTLMNGLLKQSAITKSNGVFHNTAPSRVISQLYGINKWASENNFDLVIHIHFNDYAGRKLDKVGKHTGFVIYVPDRQYSNARASRPIAVSIAKQLETGYGKSTLPKESSGVVDDQELIAIGANNTLDPAGMLIEYGYVYEPQFSPAKRDATFRNMAELTVKGLQEFFAPIAVVLR